MPNRPSPTAKRKYIDRVEVNEVFADGVERLSFDGSTLRLEFAVTRQDDQEGALWAYTAARLVLSLPAANELIEKLERLRTLMRERAAQPAGLTQ